MNIPNFPNSPTVVKVELVSITMSKEQQQEAIRILAEYVEKTDSLELDWVYSLLNV